MRYFVFQCLLQQNATVIIHSFGSFKTNIHTYIYIHTNIHSCIHIFHISTLISTFTLYFFYDCFFFILFLMWQKKHLLRAGGRSFDNPYTLKEAPRARKNNTTVPLNVPWKTKTEFFCVCHGCCPFSPLAV